MTQIQYPNDVTGSIQITHGSDGRLNVSSRSDARAYYNSRDRGQTYTVVFDDADCDVGDVFFFLKNDSTDKDLVLDAITISASVSGSYKVQFETASLSGASTLTPVNLNRNSSNLAVVTCVGNSLVTGTSVPDGVIDHVAVEALGHEEFHVNDLVRLGQGDAVSLLYDRGAANSITEGAVYFYFE